MEKCGTSNSLIPLKFASSKDIEIGYKFIRGNIGRVGKKVTLPHYMTMFM